MKKLTVIVKPANREDVIDIMESCAVYGVMETDITGYGNQKGYRVMYRGTMSGPNVLMKCKFETVGDDKTIEVLKGFLEKKLCTGNIGDGKIFVYDVEDVVKVRTGESGYPGSYRPARRGSIIKTKDSKKVQRGSQNRSFSCLF